MKCVECGEEATVAYCEDDAVEVIATIERLRGEVNALEQELVTWTESEEDTAAERLAERLGALLDILGGDEEMQHIAEVWNSTRLLRQAEREGLLNNRKKR